MTGPFRTPAKMNRAPIPPHGHHEWHPRPELLNALDEYDATELVSALKRARRERLAAHIDVFVAVMWTVSLVASLVRFPWETFDIADVLWVVACGVFVVINAGFSRRAFARAEHLRDATFSQAERALEAKLARDERPRALRLITNLDAVQRALGVGTGDSADEQDGAA